MKWDPRTHPHRVARLTILHKSVQTVLLRERGSYTHAWVKSLNNSGSPPLGSAPSSNYKPCDTLVWVVLESTDVSESLLLLFELTFFCKPF